MRTFSVTLGNIYLNLCNTEQVVIKIMKTKIIGIFVDEWLSCRRKTIELPETFLAKIRNKVLLRS